MYKDSRYHNTQREHKIYPRKTHKRNNQTTFSLEKFFSSTRDTPKSTSQYHSKIDLKCYDQTWPVRPLVKSNPSSSLGISNSSPTICSPVGHRKITPVVGDVGFSSITALVEEVGEVLDWIANLETSRSLCRPLKGIWVWVGGESRNHGGVSGFVGIKHLPRPTNLPQESLSLRMSFF